MPVQNSLPTVCIVGRTNVGKSTLFNALAGRRKAVVKDQPGVTRDRYYELVTRFDFPFTLIDTGALVGEEDLVLHEAVKQQTELAMRQSDLIIVVFDGLHGLHPLDSEVVDLVRQVEKPTIYVANKCEKPSSAMTATELYGLGLEEIIPLSAAHRRGIRELLAKMEELVGSSELKAELADGEDAAYQVNEDEEGDEGVVHFDEGDIPENADEETAPEVEHDPNKAINIAIIGKPNVGKSTFVNRLLGEDRLITSPIAGTTRDSIKCEFIGVKDDTVERFSNIRTLRSLAQSDVAVFLLDASEGIPTEQDAKIVGLAHEKGKSLVIVVNKWDLVEKDPRIAEEYRHAIRMTFKFAAYAPVIFVSALTGLRCLSVFDEVQKVHTAARVRLTTGQVNKLFTDAFNSKPPPVYRGVPIKLLYATQVAANPPTFAVFVNHPERLRFNYERYLKNTVRRLYPFPGSDVRILFRRRSRITNQRRRVA